MSIQSPTKESQEAMQAKTQAVPPMNVGSGLPEGGTVGQVLTKTATGAAWDDVPEELPEGGTTGQVLTLEVPEGETDPVPTWADPEEELPEGGTAGQVLTKTATGAAWDDVPEELPEGGTTGQVLTKTASGSEWADAAGGFSYKRIAIVYNGSTPIKDMTSFTDITSNCSIDTSLTYGTSIGGFSGEAYPYAMKIGNFVGSVIARRSPEDNYSSNCFLTGILKDGVAFNGDGILTFMLASTIVKTDTGNKPTINKLWVKYEPYTPST